MAKPHTAEFVGKKLKDVEYNGEYLFLYFEGNMYLRIGKVGESDFYFIKEAEGATGEKLDEEHQKQKKEGQKQRKENQKKKPQPKEGESVSESKKPPKGKKSTKKKNES